MDYYTYWDLESAASVPMSDEGVIKVTAIAVLIIGVLVLFFNKRLPSEFRRSAPYGILGLGLLLFASYFYIEYATKSLPEMNTFSEKQLSRVTEGRITNYKEKILNAPRGGTQTVASFDINKTSFHFSGVNLSGEKAFNLTHGKGGILNNDMKVRITYGPKQNHILKIELAKE